MSVKKMLILSAAGLASIASFAAYAGGPDVAPAPMPTDEGVYIQGDLGYANINYEGITAYSAITNSCGGFTAGGAVGYQWNRHLAGEFGGFWIDNGHTTPIGGSEIKVDRYFLYLAAKMMAPVPWVDNVDGFFKVGVAYREADPSGFSSVEMWRAMFAGGFMYHVNENWYVKAQYMYVPGLNRSEGVFVGGIPAIHSFTGGIGYKFAV